MKNEIELKIKISKKQLEMLQLWLDKKAEFCSEVNHKDCYLDNPKATFFFTSESGEKDALKFLRVRFDEKNGDSVCFKNWHLNKATGKTTHCDEIEFDVSCGKSALEMFQLLGYQKESARIKNRKIYKTKDLEIAIDNIEDNGIFSGLYVEIELKKDVKDINEGRQFLFDSLKSIGITNFEMQVRGSGKMEKVFI